MLEYNTPLTTGAAATLVFGQGGSFTSNTRATTKHQLAILRLTTANDLCDPTAVGVDGSGNLYVADSGNNRVLEYNTPLKRKRRKRRRRSTADTVFGQTGSFTTRKVQ